MAFKIVVRSDVWIDVESAIDWYNHEVTGLGQRFFQSFEQAKIKIVANPYHNSFVTKQVRRCPVKKFPYSVLYVVEEDTIYVLAVIHRRRSNAYIRKRTKR
ncbi:MAG: type II toxin-antitoxin system RelE/ParE family toxin [Lacibacter sp.]|nr:type II toxin-antitoxin system RelE/ParE family toxin [Lacibacter sp.]